MITLQNNEQIIYKIRKHWLVFALEVASFGLLAVLPIIALILIYRVGVMPTMGSLTQQGLSFTIFFYSVWLIIITHLIALIWTDYYLDVWLVTNQRVIDVEQLGLFHRRIASFRLDLIQDIKILVPGFLATFLKYGNIHIQTAGDFREFSIKNVADPYKLKEIIEREHHRARAELQQVTIVNNAAQSPSADHT